MAAAAAASSGDSPLADKTLDKLLRGPDVPAGPATLGFERHPDAPGLMLDFGLGGGDRLGLAYHFLNAIRLDPSDAITLEFADRAVVIRGRNLLPLYNHLVLHSAWRIDASETAFDERAAGTWIARIDVAPLADRRGE